METTASDVDVSDIDGTHHEHIRLPSTKSEGLSLKVLEFTLIGRTSPGFQEEVFHSLIDPFNWRCQGFNLGSSACKTNGRPASYTPTLNNIAENDQKELWKERRDEDRRNLQHYHIFLCYNIKIF